MCVDLLLKIPIAVSHSTRHFLLSCTACLSCDSYLCLLKSGQTTLVKSEVEMPSGKQSRIREARVDEEASILVGKEL